MRAGQALPQLAPASEALHRDVWNTEDGIHWTRVTDEAPWAARGMIGGSAVLDGRIWLLGGGTYQTPEMSCLKPPGRSGMRRVSIFLKFTVAGCGQLGGVREQAACRCMETDRCPAVPNVPVIAGRNSGFIAEASGLNIWCRGPMLGEREARAAETVRAGKAAVQQALLR